MSLPDFRDHRSFPGLAGGPFEIVVTWAEQMERIPAPLFAALLLAPAAAFLPLLGWGSASVGAFSLLDWLILSLLPALRVSYGPPKGPTLALAVLRLPAALLPTPINLAAQAVGTALVVYGFAVEPQRLVVTRQRLRSPKLSGGRPLRLVHLGDLHVERTTRRELALPALVRSLEPDVVLFSGDFLSYSTVYDPEAWDATRQVLEQITAPLGVFAVSGSPPVDPADVLPHVFEGTPVRWLRDEVVTLHHGPDAIDLIGVSCTHRPYLDAPRLAALLPSRPARFTILLYHSPDLAPHAAEAGVDLQLSGHTHGGQVRLPLFGALYPSSLYGKRFEVGRRRLGDMTLYVTRGLGLEGKGAPRVRFLSPPEVTLWELGSPAADLSTNEAGRG